MRLVIAIAIASIIVMTGCASNQINKDTQRNLTFAQHNSGVAQALDKNNVAIVYAMPREFSELSQRNFGITTMKSESQNIRHWDMLGVAYTYDQNDKDSSAGLMSLYKSYCEVHNGVFDTGICRRVSDQAYMFRVDIRTRHTLMFGKAFRSEIDINAFEWKTPDRQDYFSTEYYLDPSRTVGYSGMYLPKTTRQ